jgi:hypothetical protein
MYACRSGVGAGFALLVEMCLPGPLGRAPCYSQLHREVPAQPQPKVAGTHMLGGMVPC